MTMEAMDYDYKIHGTLNNENSRLKDQINTIIERERKYLDVQLNNEKISKQNNMLEMKKAVKELSNTLLLFEKEK